MKGVPHGVNGEFAQRHRTHKDRYVWEKKFDEFKRCVGMPKRETPLSLATESVEQYTW